MLYAVSRPPSLTIVLTASMTCADGSMTSTSGMTSCFHGIETAQPRMPSARTPLIAPTMSSVVKAL